jgi:hypothetical protein
MFSYNNSFMKETIKNVVFILGQKQTTYFFYEIEKE